MSSKMKVVVISMVALALVSVLVVSVAFAADAGTTPQQGLAATGQPAELAGGSNVWYVFQYSGDGSQILIELYNQGSGGMSFTVWTPEQVKQWQAGQSVDPVGAGTPNPDLKSDLSWLGGFNIPGTYYVQVSNARADAKTYTLTITGSGVSMPAGAPAQAQLPLATTQPQLPLATPSGGEAAVPAPAPPASSGVNPENALPISGVSATANAATSTWYGFQYAGDQSQIQVMLNAQGQSGLTFSVWTPQQIKVMEAGQAVDPVGRGSPNPDIAGADQYWTGSFNTPGTYYVQVQNMGSSALNYTLTISGSGVSMLPGTSAASAAPAASASATSTLTATTGVTTTTAVTATTTTTTTTATPAATASPSATATAAASPTASATAAAGGSRPDTALPISGAAVTLPGSSVAWYKFGYAGDMSQIFAYVNNGGANNFGFSVWTADQLRQVARGQTVDPVGRGSANPDAQGDLSWSGNFSQPGTYYIRVENNGSAPVNYSLNIKGTGVQ